MKGALIRWVSITLGVLLAAAWVKGFHVESLGSAALGALIIGVVFRVMSVLFSLQVKVRTPSQQPPPRPGEMKPVEGRVIDADEH